MGIVVPSRERPVRPSCTAICGPSPMLHTKQASELPDFPCIAATAAIFFALTSTLVGFWVEFFAPPLPTVSRAVVSSRTFVPIIGGTLLLKPLSPPPPPPSLPFADATEASTADKAFVHRGENFKPTVILLSAMRPTQGTRCFPYAVNIVMTQTLLLQAIQHPGDCIALTETDLTTLPHPPAHFVRAAFAMPWCPSNACSRRTTTCCLNRTAKTRLTNEQQSWHEPYRNRNHCNCERDLSE